MGFGTFRAAPSTPKPNSRQSKLVREACKSRSFVRKNSSFEGGLLPFARLRPAESVTAASQNCFEKHAKFTLFCNEIIHFDWGLCEIKAAFVFSGFPQSYLTRK